MERKKLYMYLFLACYLITFFSSSRHSKLKTNSSHSSTTNSSSSRSPSRLSRLRSRTPRNTSSPVLSPSKPIPSRSYTRCPFSTHRRSWLQISEKFSNSRACLLRTRSTRSSPGAQWTTWYPVFISPPSLSLYVCIYIALLLFFLFFSTTQMKKSSFFVLLQIVTFISRSKNARVLNLPFRDRN